MLEKMARWSAALSRLASAMGRMYTRSTVRRSRTYAASVSRSSALICCAAGTGPEEAAASAAGTSAAAAATAASRTDARVDLALCIEVRTKARARMERLPSTAAWPRQLCESRVSVWVPPCESIPIEIRPSAPAAGCGLGPRLGRPELGSAGMALQKRPLRRRPLQPLFSSAMDTPTLLRCGIAIEFGAASSVTTEESQGANADGASSAGRLAPHFSCCGEPHRQNDPTRRERRTRKPASTSTRSGTTTNTAMTAAFELEEFMIAPLTGGAVGIGGWDGGSAFGGSEAGGRQGGGSEGGCSVGGDVVVGQGGGGGDGGAPRTPQSAQSVPSGQLVQLADSAPGPPSSQVPSSDQMTV